MSRDGRIAEAVGKRSDVTGDQANRYVHQLRSGFDAIVVGAETALVDDPLLTVRHGLTPRVAPTRVVLDSTCRMSPEARLLATVDQAPVLVFVTPAAPSERVGAIQAAGAGVVTVAEHEGRVDLDAALAACWERGLTSVLCEGGGRLASALVREGLVQRLYILEAPVSFGAQGVPAFPDAAGTPDGEGWREGWRTVGGPRPLGVDMLVTYDREV
jgi:diaminohydroxyphosphoribosylaminopyrimidine deaminase/5-amino-6-(5-phosphoribosylamino)uracil reductase